MSQPVNTVELRQSVLDEVQNECLYQEDKWGTVADDTRNTPFHWVTWITRYSTSWCAGIWDLRTINGDAFRKAMLKVAAIAVSAVVSLDRQRATRLANLAFYEHPDD